MRAVAPIPEHDVRAAFRNAGADSALGATPLTPDWLLLSSSTNERFQISHLQLHRPERPGASSPASSGNQLLPWNQVNYLFSFFLRGGGGSGLMNVAWRGV